MRDWTTLGPTPAEEECEQVGTEKYDPYRARIETRVFVNMLRRIHKPEHTEIKLHTENGHDAGPYIEAAVYYDPQNDAAVQEMLRIEGGVPGKWDDEAREELELALSRLAERYAGNQ